jgi:hypothetical protein
VIITLDAGTLPSRFLFLVVSALNRSHLLWDFIPDSQDQRKKFSNNGRIQFNPGSVLEKFYYIDKTIYKHVTKSDSATKS